MAPRKFTKNNSQTFSLVFRAQNDPRIHDQDASDMVFTEKLGQNISSDAESKINLREDLDDEFGLNIRDNEGEAATHGIYYDDSEYDYMQHMRELGAGGNAHFVEPTSKAGKKVKGQRLEDAIRDLDIGSASEVRSQTGYSVASSNLSTASSFFHDDQLPSEFVRPSNYQDMQDVPDSIRGFQPNLDPRLREVLDALDDEAYVDDDEELFANLQDDAEEMDNYEFEELTEQLDSIPEDDEGWVSDNTVTAKEDGATSGDGVSLRASDAQKRTGDTDDGENNVDVSWMEEYSKFKSDQKPHKTAPGQRRIELQSEYTAASSLMSGRRKKRKGALTSTSGYSMSSSVLVRTEGQSIMDRRFDKLEADYADGEDEDEGRFDDADSIFSGMSGVSKASGVSKMSFASGISSASKSQAPQVLRADFDSIMDDFLGKHHKVGKKSVRRGKPQTGLEQLDEIREQLGPARVKASRST